MRNLALGFYINLVIGGVFSPVYIFVLPSFDPLKGRSVIDRLKPYDGVGTVLSIVGLLCPIMAIDFGETLYSWKSGSTIVLFVVGGLALIAFALQQTFKWLTTEQNRLFPVHFVRMKEPELLFILMAANNCSSMVSMVSSIQRGRNRQWTTRLTYHLDSITFLSTFNLPVECSH